VAYGAGWRAKQSRDASPYVGRGSERYSEEVEKSGRDLIAGYIAAVAALMLFGWLARDVLRHQSIRFDAVVRDAVHSLASPGLTTFFGAVTWLGSELFLLPFGALVVWRLAAAGRKHAAVLLVLAAAGGELLDQILKLAFHRGRPAAFFGYPLPETYSFPSGHSMVSICFFGVLAAVLTARMASRARRAAVWAAAVAVVLMIGVSRIYLGVHYPSDVVAGYCAAIIWVAAVRAGYIVWLRRRAGQA
jgi:undecaprenyl-diphosphatase